MTSAPGEKLIIKLWDTIVDKGVCGIFRTGQMKREGLANSIVARNQVIMLAQAEREAEDIRAGLLTAKVEGGNVILIPNKDKYEPILDLPKMYASIEHDIIMNHLAGEINLAKTILKAEEELESSLDQATDNEVDLEWITRWREYAINFSSEELQSLWARVLAGEVKAPGKFSIRTLEFIKTLTRSEAREIEQLTPFIFNIGMIYRGYLGDYIGQGRTIHRWLSVDFLERMQEYGLVSSIHEERMEMTLPCLDNETYYITCNDKAIVYKCTQSKINTTFLFVTRLGVQLAEISKCKANMEYVLKFAQHIKVYAESVYISDFYHTNEGIVCFNKKYI
ncbi:DUF2806 domain-containing protein [Klebsiella oxytoca]